MLKVEIKWNFISPFLKVASGIVKIIDDHFQRDEPFEIGVYEINLKENTTEIKLVRYDPSKLANKDLTSIINKIIHTMTDSYFRGMILQKYDYEWIDYPFNEMAILPCSSEELERLTTNQKAVGSNPTRESKGKRMRKFKVGEEVWFISNYKTLINSQILKGQIIFKLPKVRYDDYSYYSIRTSNDFRYEIETKYIFRKEEEAKITFEKILKNKIKEITKHRKILEDAVERLKRL